MCASLNYCVNLEKSLHLAKLVSVRVKINNTAATRDLPQLKQIPLSLFVRVRPESRELISFRAIIHNVKILMIT